MNRTLLAILLASICACGGPATTTQPTRASTAVSVEHQRMIATIDQFLRDPGAGDPNAILSFVKQSPAVLVVYDQRLLPMDPSMPEGTAALLMAGFAAGSARGQLASGVKRASPVDGVRGMLAIYSFLRAKAPAVSSKQLDELAAREAGGSLDAAVAERLAQK